MFHLVTYNATASELVNSKRPFKLYQEITIHNLIGDE